MPENVHPSLAYAHDARCTPKHKRVWHDQVHPIMLYCLYKTCVFTQPVIIDHYCMGVQIIHSHSIEHVCKDN